MLYAALLVLGLQRTRDNVLPFWRLLILPGAVVAMTVASAIGAGVGLLPVRMFAQDLARGRLVQPFAACVDAGRYWLTHLRSRPAPPALRVFGDWLAASAAIAP